MKSAKKQELMPLENFQKDDRQHWQLLGGEGFFAELGWIMWLLWGPKAI